MAYPVQNSNQYYPFTIYYGGIQIPYNQSNFSYEPVYDENNIDFLYNHITITANCIINPELFYTLNPDALGGKPMQVGQNDGTYGPSSSNPLNNAQYLQIINDLLNLPRQRLIYTDAQGFPIIDTGATDGKNTIDCRNGPLVKANAFELDGLTIIANIKIECWLIKCLCGSDYSDATETSPSLLLSNRWSMKQDIDQEGLSTYTTTGYMIFRTDIQNIFGSDNKFLNPIAGQISLNPALFRGLPSPITWIYPNCNRIAQNFSESPDHTRCDWQIVDKEFYRPGVNGLTTWDGTWEQSCKIVDNGGEASGRVIGVFSATGKGSTATSKQEIFSTLMTAAFSRITPQDILMNWNVVEGLRDNTIQVKLQVLMVQQTATPAKTSSANGATGGVNAGAGSVITAIQQQFKPGQTALFNNFRLRVMGLTSADAGNPQNAYGIGGPVYPFDLSLQSTNISNPTPQNNLTVVGPYNNPHHRYTNIGQTVNNIQNLPPFESNVPLLSVLFANYINTSLANNYCTSSSQQPGTYCSNQFNTKNGGIQANPAAIQNDYQATSNQYPAYNVNSGSGSSSTNSSPTGNGGGAPVGPINVAGIMQSTAQAIENTIYQTGLGIASVAIGVFNAIKQLLPIVSTDILALQGTPRTMYVHYKLEQEMVEDHGILQLPLMTDTNGVTCDFVQVRQPVSRVRVYWEAARLNYPPQVPAPGIPQTAYTQLAGRILMQNLEFMPDGQNRVFYMSGEWTYGVNCYLNLGNNPLQFPTTPLDIKGLNAPNNNTKTSQAPGDSAQGAFIGGNSPGTNLWQPSICTPNTGTGGQYGGNSSGNATLAALWPSGPITSNITAAQANPNINVLGVNQGNVVVAPSGVAQQNDGATVQLFQFDFPSFDD